MSILWAWLSKYALAGAAAVVAALLLAVGVQTHRVKVAKQETEQVRLAWSAQREQATAAAFKASNDYRALEQQMQAQSEKSYRDYNAAQSRNESALAAARADTGRLRSDLAAFARGGGPAVDTQPAASGRAAALGDVLDSVLLDLATCARDAESGADGVRALKAAWPTPISLGKMRLGSRRHPSPQSKTCHTRPSPVCTVAT